ncbi:hypothetical protein [Chondromyces crocatus]|uniref:Uncharacterized protein n=1 Tax=Chondromyces crocatus TaxID=52 RepID=A0A0K1EK70_CHOCO|nr:hypothetical protein [Chondromyces crocatus]AKT41261.1 uncharacterized protein CMC5_054280 [Chondromyces crocatus]
MNSNQPFKILVLPELLTGSRRRTSVLILADGNRRASPHRQGYGRGAHRVVEIATHLARRGDVTEMVACVLSKDNIHKRGASFFDELTAQFVALRARIERDSALIRDGIRMTIVDDLRPLYAKGGSCTALAEAMRRAADATCHQARPTLDLSIAAGYSEELAIERSVDLILRTGMECEGVLRLSGLRSHAGCLAYATSKLWPEVAPQDLDRILDDARLRMHGKLARGHHPRTLQGLVLALRQNAPRKSTCVTIPSCVDEGEISRMLGATCPRMPSPAPTSYRLPDHPQHELRIVGTGEKHGGGYDAIIAPGQTPPFFVLMESLSPGYANVHACTPDAQGIVQGIHQALEFASTYVALQGAEREGVSEESTISPVIPLMGEHQPGFDGEAFATEALAAEAFATRALQWATRAGLMSAASAWQRAATNYALTAFYIPPDDMNDHEPLRELMMRYMLLVAAGDYEVFDVTFPGETPQSRTRRIGTSAKFLLTVAASGDIDAQPPATRDAQALQAIASQWRGLVWMRHGASDAALVKDWIEAVRSMYTACHREHLPSISDSSRLQRSTQAGTRQAGMKLFTDRYIASSPAAIGDRIQWLLESLLTKEAAAHPAADELRVLLRLVETRNSMAAGLLFRTAALQLPMDAVTDDMRRALHDVAELLDFSSRLANDLSGFRLSGGADLDEKTTSCSLLVSAHLAGERRVAVIARATTLCRSIAAWLETLLETAVRRLTTLWPSLAVMVRRGMHIGRRVYNDGHYTTLSRAQMNAIVQEMRTQNVDDASSPTSVPPDAPGAMATLRMP